MNTIPKYKQEKPISISGTVIYEEPVNLMNIKFRGRLNTVGIYSYANSGVIIYDSDIGRFTSIGPNVLIGPLEHPMDRISTHGFVFGDRGVFKHDNEYHQILSSKSFDFNDKRTTIGNDVWIGANVFIRRGVTIGNGAIIAANSSVTKDVPPYCIVGGNPANIIRLRFSVGIINELNKIQWWNYILSKDIVGDIDYSDIENCIVFLKNMIRNKKLKKYNPRKIKITRFGYTEVDEKL